MELFKCIYCCNRKLETFSNNDGYNIYCPNCYIKSIVAEDEEKAGILWNYEHSDPSLIQWVDKHSFLYLKNDLNLCKKCNSDEIRIVFNLNNPSDLYYFVFCKKCFRMTYKCKTQQIAEEKWNEFN